MENYEGRKRRLKKGKMGGKQKGSAVRVKGYMRKVPGSSRRIRVKGYRRGRAGGVRG